jgi:hypothetical protein
MRQHARLCAGLLLALASSLLAPQAIGQPASAPASNFPALVAPSPPGPSDSQMHDRISLGFVGIVKMADMPVNRDLGRATHPELYAYLEAYGMHVRMIGWSGSSVALWLTSKQPLWRINAVGRLLMQAYPGKYSYFESDEYFEVDPEPPRRHPSALTPGHSSSGPDPSAKPPAAWLEEPTAVPSDPGYAQQWHYHDATAGIRLPGAWALSKGKGATVAVVDSGVRPHCDLRARLGVCGGSIKDMADSLRWSCGVGAPGVPMNPAPAQVITLSALTPRITHL